MPNPNEPPRRGGPPCRHKRRHSSKAGPCLTRHRAGVDPPPIRPPLPVAPPCVPSHAPRIFIIREGKEPGRTFPISKERMSIGRSRESEIFLEDLARPHVCMLDLSR